jgi:HD domain
MRGLGVLGLVPVVLRRGSWASAAVFRQSTPQIKADSVRLPAMVAGIRLVDSAIARRAVELSRDCSAPFLFNHTVRTYLFGSLAGRALGQQFDEEVLFLACVLHDLGLTERFQGDLPFEIQGAQAAKQFLIDNAYPKEGAEMVWDGIAMHPLAIGQFKRPEIALVGAGAGADVLGPDSSQVTKNDIGEILRAFPRLGFKTAFVKGCADVVRLHPRTASRSFMRDIGERYVEGYHPKNFCDLVTQAPFPE